MFRVFMTHLYVIVMSIFVIATGNIIADRYGDDIVNTIYSWVGSADDGLDDMKSTVKDWNKNMLD